MRDIWIPWGGHLARPIRRALVLVMYLAFFVFLYALYVANGVFNSSLLAAILIAGVVALLAWVRLLRAPGYVGDVTDRNLDERQRSVRDRAYRLAYPVLVLVFVVISVIAMMASGNDANWVELRLAGRYLPWLAFVAGSLPTAAIAWTAEDEVAD